MEQVTNMFTDFIEIRRRQREKQKQEDRRQMAKQEEFKKLQKENY